MAFERRLPRWAAAILGIAQLALTAAIIGLEFGSFYYDVAHGTIWIGFWAGLVFIKTSLMMLCFMCCCRGRCFATYILICNIFSGALACVVIYFDSYFINNLCRCYLGENLCCALHDLSSINSNYGSIVTRCLKITMNGIQSVPDSCPSSPPTSKVVYLKAQLGCAAGMLAVCSINVLVYIFACFGICFGHD
ncbi:unnamed protein product [Rotaria magnacalcarata]|uniref:Uncharacterized protein n=1 Tax=Rotaria magnacalcarata TaxID=392030 RepID=A0A816P014_9BILA|nr:unnamed protein product [Rotaria magnacalcarata]CAF1560688.1 unnamed protein product [Rotaria magnacalcarata]CAF2042343.1 unnamed protein product [Rotaria magnacalcarata]CAF2115405.1 unnamed protein product [Rotaria magnacalcarata]CAF2131254.1 unnamed protein product [Rotaria magnacalcarata]